MNLGRDRGAADALGLVLIAPAVIGLAILVVALGRGVDAYRPYSARGCIAFGGLAIAKILLGLVTFVRVKVAA